METSPGSSARCLPRSASAARALTPPTRAGTLETVTRAASLLSLLSLLGCNGASDEGAPDAGGHGADGVTDGSTDTSTPSGEPGVAHQSAPYEVNPTSQWEGTTTLEEMRSWGDFGVGALEGFKAELVIDGEPYAVTSDGVPRPVADDELGLYTVITHFEAEQRSELEGPVTCDELTRTVLPALLPDPDAMYALRIDGHFSQAQPRSFRGWDPPYPSALVLITTGEVRFDLADVSGSIIAYYFPPGASSFCSLGANCAQEGFHLHFITDDGRAGGHLLSCVAESGDVSISPIHELNLRMLDGAIETFTGP